MTPRNTALAPSIASTTIAHRDLKPEKPDLVVKVAFRTVVDPAGARRQLDVLDRLLAEVTPDESGRR